MTDEPTAGEGAAEFLLAHLERSGFFRSIEQIRGNIATVARDLEALRASAFRREQDYRTLAARVLALESILAVVLRRQEVDLKAVRQMIRFRGGEAGSVMEEMAEAEADSLVMSSRN